MDYADIITNDILQDILADKQAIEAEATSTVRDMIANNYGTFSDDIIDTGLLQASTNGVLTVLKKSAKITVKTDKRAYPEQPGLTTIDTGTQAITGTLEHEHKGRRDYLYYAAALIARNLDLQGSLLE